MNIFVTSDLWFYRHNIIGIFKRPFEDIAHMNEALVERWNCVVGEDDIVFVLGGFNYDSTKYESLLNCLRGRIVLVPTATDTLVAQQNMNFMRFTYSDILSPLLNRFDDVPSGDTLKALEGMCIRFAIEESSKKRKISRESLSNQLYGMVLRQMIGSDEVNIELADMLVELCSAIVYGEGNVKSLVDMLSDRVKDKFAGRSVGDTDITQKVLDRVNVESPVKYWDRLVSSEDSFTMSEKNIIEIPTEGVVLSAYPLLDWNGKAHGTLNIHGGTVKSNLYEGRFNVRTDLCDFSPVSLQSVIDLNLIVKGYSDDKETDKGNKDA
jgi:calcineurin-like phosphoesterase family protein